MAYTWPATRKACVRRRDWQGLPHWAAGRPGGTYLHPDGFHFHDFRSALDHALKETRR